MIPPWIMDIYNLVPKKYLPFCVASTWIRQDFLIDNDIEIDLIFISLNYLNHQL
jgi:5'(3')-deoxyribonucleotidase